VRHAGRRRRGGVDRRMALSSGQRQVLERWMHSKAIIQCPACGDADGWRFAEAAYVRALLDDGEQDLTEDRGGGEGCLWQLRVRDALRC